MVCVYTKLLADFFSVYAYFNLYDTLQLFNNRGQRRICAQLLLGDALSKHMPTGKNVQK